MLHPSVSLIEEHLENFVLHNKDPYQTIEEYENKHVLNKIIGISSPVPEEASAAKDYLEIRKLEEKREELNQNELENKLNKLDNTPRDNFKKGLIYDELGQKHTAGNKINQAIEQRKFYKQLLK